MLFRSQPFCLSLPPSHPFLYYSSGFPFTSLQPVFIPLLTSVSLFSLSPLHPLYRFHPSPTDSVSHDPAFPPSLPSLSPGSGRKGTYWDVMETGSLDPYLEDDGCEAGTQVSDFNNGVLVLPPPLASSGEGGRQGGTGGREGGREGAREGKVPLFSPPHPSQMPQDQLL